MKTVRRSAATFALGAALVAGHGALAQTPSQTPPQTPPSAAPAAALAPVDYGDKANWVCWPGASPNACDIDLTTTIVGADGSMTVEPFKADAAAPIDCFYVYPTV